jgi:dienelactone hydrolase
MCVSYEASAIGNDLDTINRKWLGKLEIPNGPKLTVTIELFKKADGTFGAVMGSPDQGRMGIPVDKFDFSDNIIRFDVNALGGVIEGTLSEDHSSIDAELSQRGAKIPLQLNAVDELPSLKPRRQLPNKPYPYVEEEVVFENKTDGVKLSGTLSRPSNSGPFPGVLLVAGSGRNDRDATGMGHFQLLADYLTRHGIATLRYDKRGVMRSTGSFESASLDDFIQDAAAGLSYLKSRKDVVADKVGLIGHSEGGVVAPMAAVSSSGAAFVVSLGGTGINGFDLMVLQDCSEARAGGATDQDITLIREWVKRFYAIVRDENDIEKAKDKLNKMYVEMTPAEKKAFKAEKGFPTPGTTLHSDVALAPWFREFVQLNPHEAYKKIDCPVLVLIGSKDTQVPPKENLNGIENALKAGGHSRYSLLEMPDLNHLFQTAETGSTSEYDKLEEIIAPSALITVTHWIMEQTELLPAHISR